MTAKKKIIDKNGVQVYPITHTKAVLDDNGNSVEQRLQEQVDIINQKQLEVGAVPSDVTPTEGSTNWVTSGGVHDAINNSLITDKTLTIADVAADAKTVGDIVGVENIVGEEIIVSPIEGGYITSTNTVRANSGFSYVKDLDVSSCVGVRVQCQPAGTACLLAMDEDFQILKTYSKISNLTDFDFNIIADGIKYISISSMSTISVHELNYSPGATVRETKTKADLSYISAVSGVNANYITGYYLRENGSSQSYNGSYISNNFIPIPIGMKSFLYKGHWLGSSVNVAFWGSDTTEPAFDFVRVNPTSNDYQLITVPEGALNMKVSSIDSIPELITSSMEIASYFMLYMNNYISDLENNIFLNHLSGKVMVGLGDSEMAGQGQTPHCKLIADRNNMTFYNHAAGGQHITRTASDDVLGLIENDADYIIVQIGYNDAQNPSYLDDTTTDNSTDASTFKGAFNHIVEYIQTNHPSSLLGFILPRYYEDDTVTGQNHERHYATSMWIAKRAKTLHIPFFDETANSGMSYSIAEQRQLYFQDYVHLSAAGFERVSYPIEHWLRGL